MTEAGRAVRRERTRRRAVAAYAGPAKRQTPDDVAAARGEPDSQAMFDVLTSAKPLRSDPSRESNEAS